MRALDVESRLWIGAVVCLVVFGVLGAYVSSRGPTRVDVAATALRGEAPLVAAFFTALGRWYLLVPLSVLALGVAFAVRADVLAVAGVVAAQTVSQAAVALAKSAFHRARPEGWLRVHELDPSYPSGHAVTSVVFFAGLLCLVLRSPVCPRPVALTLASVLAVCVLGIPWSRLALGAHYATDVAGGLLFGAACLCGMAALYVRFHTAA